MSAPLASDRGFRRAVQHLHRLGPRPLGEFLGEVVAAMPEAAPVVVERLEAYALLDPHTVAWLAADDWLEPAAVVRLVSGGRP